MEYSELEKKVIAKGLSDFRKELKEASKPMLKVLSKYGIYSGNPVLKKITLYRPDHFLESDEYAVNIPCDSELESIKRGILKNFLAEISELKERVGKLPFDLEE